MSRIGVLLKQAFHALAGLKIAVVGLVLGFVLVLVGTLDQVNLGIYYTVKEIGRAHV